MSILHILNGDSTAQSFEDTGLEGDVLVWREVLSEGPLAENITSADFWRNRSEWIGDTFSEVPGNYQHAVLDQLAKLEEGYCEINLWFEYDLHCQANMLGVIAYLEQKTDLSAPAVYLICPADFPGKERFGGMGELTGDELTYLYDRIRVQLNEMDFMLTKRAWAIYVSRDEEKLRDFLHATDFWGNLQNLKPALAAQLKRLPTDDKGLNYIEQKLLEVYNYGYKTWPEILSVFWQSETIYGMGDLEIDIYLKRLIKKGLISLQNK